MAELEKILIINSIISLIAHTIIGIRWMWKKSLTVERKALIRLHIKQHGGKLKDCAECETLFSLEHQPQPEA